MPCARWSRSGLRPEGSAHGGEGPAGGTEGANSASPRKKGPLPVGVHESWAGFQTPLLQGRAPAAGATARKR